MLISINRSLNKLYADLEPLMSLDPLLLTTVVYVCPKHELHFLFSKIPSLFAAAWLIKDVRDDRFFLRSDVSSLNDHSVCQQLITFCFMKVETIVELTNVIISRQRTESLTKYGGNKYI